MITLLGMGLIGWLVISHLERIEQRNKTDRLRRLGTVKPERNTEL